MEHSSDINENNLRDTEGEEQRDPLAILSEKLEPIS
jgi:hypothetical protein